MQIADRGSRLLANLRLSAFDKEATTLWRFRSSPDLVQEAMATWGWGDNPFLHDGELRLFGFYLVVDPELPMESLLLEGLRQ